MLAGIWYFRRDFLTHISCLMSGNSFSRYPRAILHIDGDAFFASCEQARNPDLRGKPVITGLERGIASSMSYEAKRLGITRAMKLSDIKKLCPDAVILPSDYETYSLLSRRFYEVVRRYTDAVEEYGIDECFADLTGWERPHRMSYENIARSIQNDLSRELGFTFSIGLSSTKVLAKIGSKWQKPHGLTCISSQEIPRYLKKLAIRKVWGIGRETSTRMYQYGIFTALDFASKDEVWVKQRFAKPHQEIWRELNGENALPLNTEGHTTRASIQKMKTFTPPSVDPKFVFSQLARNIESACIRARGYGLEATTVSLLLRTQAFEHQSTEVKLTRPTNFPHDLINILRPIFDKLFLPHTPYRATMITLHGLAAPTGQADLFGASSKVTGYHHLYAGIDRIRKKYGKHTVHLGASYLAQKFSQHEGDRGKVVERKILLLKGESKRKRLNIPVFLGVID